MLVSVVVVDVMRVVLSREGPGQETKVKVLYQARQHTVSVAGMSITLSMKC